MQTERFWEVVTWRSFFIFILAFQMATSGSTKVEEMMKIRAKRERQNPPIGRSWGVRDPSQPGQARPGTNPLVPITHLRHFLQCGSRGELTKPKSDLQI